MNTQDIKNCIKADLDKVKTLLFEGIINVFQDGNLIPEIRVWAEAEPLRETIMALNSNSGSTRALQAMSLLNWWRAQFNTLTAQVTAGAAGAQISAVWNGVVNTVQSLLNSITSGFWSLLTQLLTVKEWSVAGDAGVNLLGLQGTVKVEVTFA